MRRMLVWRNRWWWWWQPSGSRVAAEWRLGGGRAQALGGGYDLD
jgi:hypothetical protein